LVYSRRFFLASYAAALSAGACARALSAPRSAADVEGGKAVAPPLLERALGALERHRDSIEHRDLIGVVDFSLPSRAARFRVVNLATGHANSYLVAHGRGSDPTHTGWLERFSNDPGSYATSSGAFRTGSLYVGAHGHSMRLDGLDPTNSNAASRAIVVHGAWYVSETMIDHSGMLGRSEGCFAVSNSSLGEIISALGPGRLIYADRA
jgi:L,D-transpeptidase catalytic domain